MTAVILLVLRSILVIALYVFLGWALWILWQDLKQQSKKIEQNQQPPLKISVQIRDEIRELEFSAAEITIGRDPKCDCYINSKTVSTHHALLSFDQNQWWLQDLESTNGTLLNQELISSQTVIAPGDKIQCGEALITIEKSP